jgi:outer membrane protein TolC
METEREIAETEIAFLRLLGLRPGTKITLTIPLKAKPSLPSVADDPLELVRHPKVEAALARLGATEKSLEAEIRRQYPNLKLGPAYANEEGLDRFGLIAGMSIPLWNRNRKGIAEAEGARDEARLAAIDAWRSLVCDAATARVHLSNLLMHPPVPANEREQADRLADAGELTPLDYLAVREQIFDLRLDELNWRRDVALAAAELQRFNIDR